jgi:hypothetical protein
MEELLYPILLPDRVHIGDLVLGYCGEVQVNLQKPKIMSLAVKKGFKNQFSIIDKLVTLTEN